jgi:hypothetical protein
MRLWSDLYATFKGFVKGIWKSFFTDDEGASARKLSAFAAVAIAYYITVCKLPEVAQIDALYAWLLFALLCLGIVTVEQLIRLKNEKNESKDEN